ncbi:MAG: hypothetical protein QOG52_58 [Frankiaceae bacterium]|jgi:hypothetical protein|nr:hypothetical protein [Frankiaceae bacterium]
MSASRGVRRFWRTELVALSAASVSSVGLIVLAATTPFYTSSASEQTSSGAVINHPSTSATLLQVNGPIVLAIAGVPLTITLAVLGIFWTRGVERGPGAIAWTIVGLLVALTVAGMLTVGSIIFPITACLVTACGVRQARRRPS